MCHALYYTALCDSSAQINEKIIFAASINIDEIMQGGIAKSSILQEVLPGIAFCSLEDEFNDRISSHNANITDESNIQIGNVLPPGFSKLFRLAQLIIQYLLHSQKKLTEAIKVLQTSNDELRKVCLFLAKTQIN